MMRLLNSDSLAGLNTKSVIVTKEAPVAFSYRDGTTVERVVISLEKSSNLRGSEVLLAHRLVWRPDDNVGATMDLLPSDASYVFWLSERGMWDDLTEDTGELLLQSLMKGFGYDPETRGIECDVDDLSHIDVMGLVVIMFGWDAYLMPKTGRFICHISHHGVIELESPEPSIVSELLSRLSYWGAVLEKRP